MLNHINHNLFYSLSSGVGGNLAAVQTSRISTYLHRRAPKKRLPEGDEIYCGYPGKVFFSKKSKIKVVNLKSKQLNNFFPFISSLGAHSIMARLLLCLSIPSHLLFIFLIKLVRDHFAMTPTFLGCYMFAAIFQVAILIQISYYLVHFLWIKGFNPDNSALPFLTALGDFIGSALLAVAFVVLMNLKDVNAYKKIEPDIRRTIKTIKTTPASTTLTITMSSIMTTVTESVLGF